MNLVLLAILASIAATPTPTLATVERTYSVGLRFIPGKLDPRRSQINTDRYILMHVYEPMFRAEPDGRLSSAFLDLDRTRSTSPDFRSFELCLKQNAAFSDDSRIEVSHLTAAVVAAHAIQENLPPMTRAQESGPCLIVNLGKPEPNYFDKLTSLVGTILKSEEYEFAPIGLGAYRVASHSKDRISLRAIPGRVAGDFKKIQFHRYVDVPHALADRIDDWNHIYQMKVPESVTQRQQVVESPTYKTYALIVNIPDARLRARFAACLNKEAIPEIFSMKLTPVPGFLPKGIPGWNVNYRATPTDPASCTAGASQGRIKWLNWRPDAHGELMAELTRQAPRLPLRVDVEPLDPAGIPQIGFDRKPKVILVGFDTSGSASDQTPESSVFFEAFYRSNRLINAPVVGLEASVRAAAIEPNRRAKDQKYSRAHQLLLESGYIVPLGQLQSSQYYPSNVSRIVWADRVSGYPRIDLMKVSNH